MVAPDSLMEPPTDRSSAKDPIPPLSNGNQVPETTDRVPEEVHKPPSYVALACCISGYTSLVYDSKQRQGLHSRTASPIRVDGLRNSSYASECGNFLTSNSRGKTDSKMQTHGKENSYGLDFLNGCSGLHSPRHVANMTITKENLNYKSSMVSEKYSSYSTSTTRYSYSPSSQSPLPPVNGNTTNGTSSKLIAPTNITQQLSPSSFIVQRVERLYGPGALAQGFYTLKKNNTTPTNTTKIAPKESISKAANGEKNDDSLPVLKLLRPEFRAQLTVASRKGRTSLPDKTSCPEEVKQMETLNVSDDIDATALKPAALEREEAKDGHYFLKLHSDQVTALEELATIGEKELSSCDNDEACGVLRAASGKARLLVAQKLNQFKGLCLKNIEQSSSDDFPTTCEDLAGFWDMVMIQVEDVRAQFKAIEALKKNNWKPVEEKTDDPAKGSAKPAGATTKKAIAKKIEPKAKEANRARDEARRKMIEERRRAMKESRDANANDFIVV
ncbi:Guanylate-kinase-associated protein (GKAP) protein [Nesidiocoris tenuis]|uniref:Guanylate-kinase-associated protein (GKAP) protein n=1 Tax=Nesidiocoris tenuis TaxID=355587 RepID=A0ABN7B2P2_9HEMI|nr:Guanylate-kinase-associated protein (GKAP) protein [Nesidiocoris tenuis]